MKTINGIELDLPESEYRIKIKDYIFYFSSNFYLENFSNNLKNFVKLEEAKIKNKYKFFIDLELYLTFVFYKKIEKRGFYIIDAKTGKEIKEINFISELIKEGK